MKIHGIGCDVIEIARLQVLYARYGEKLLSRLLTPREIEQAMRQHSPVPRLAKYVAAKEAAFKALRVGRSNGLSWQHFEVIYDAPTGAPVLLLHGAARSLLPKRTQLHLSLSDTAAHAMAYVVIEVAD